PQYVIGRNGDQIILRNYKYDIFTYPDVEEEPKKQTRTVEKRFKRKKPRPKPNKTVYEPDKVQV
ncbi:MAG: hypothetical protein KAJ12_09170, partial [Bacteroidetes bacterium]|nr:hypothetical protein [Bacteroidota bacterium]